MNDLRNNYIQLLRDCVSYWLWISPEKREYRFSGRDYPKKKGHGETMIGLQRLDNIFYCLKRVIAEGIEGDVMETGVWRGGAVIFMKGILDAYEQNQRSVWVADSFCGLPAPNSAQYPMDEGLNFDPSNFLGVSKKEVEANFRKYNLLDKRVKFLEGWFKDTLYTDDIGKLSLIRLDGDLYESTYQALDALYPKLSAGGYCIIDDYLILDCCRQAVTDYRERMKITDPIINIDSIGVFWKKS